MLVYLVKSAACMGIFLLFYKLFLEKENMHVFKRFYLIVTIIVALVIPNLVFVEYVEPIITNTNYTFTQTPDETPFVATQVQVSDMDVFNWQLLAWSIYGIGAIIFGFRFLRNLFQIINRVQKNLKHKQGYGIKVLLLEQLPPHTFFKYIFLNKQKFDTNEIPEEVVLHEEIHAKQNHSLDVVFIELLHILLWFNPLLYFFKKSIKLNHEFLADSAVLKKINSPQKYQNTLLSYLSQDSLNKYQSVKMANAINYSSIKKRFIIMKTKTSKQSKVIKSLLVLPLVAVLLFGFSETKMVEKPKEIQNYVSGYENLKKVTQEEIMTYNQLAKKYNIVPIEKRIIPLNDLKVLESIYKKMTKTQKENTQPFPECLPKNQQVGVTKQQMTEYNALAKKYNSMLSEAHFTIQIKDVERLKYLYSLMSEKQKADAEPFPNFPEPPPVPANPEEIKHKPTGRIITPQTKKYNIGGKDSYNSAEFRSPPEVYEATPPPVPPNPLDHIIAMAKQGATFYYMGKKISSDKALELLKKNKSLNISTTKNGSKNPQVRISKKPISIKRTSSRINLETGNIKVNGKELFYSTKNGITSYFNDKGEHVDKQGRLLTKEQKKAPTFYFNGNQISSVKAHQLLRNNKSIKVATENYTKDEYAIVLTDISKASYNQNHNKNNNPNSVIDLTEMIAKEASFYFNDKPISVEKALWLTKNERIDRVNNVESKTGKPKVYLWKKV